jgi:superfamily I DNA/RNA helicase
MKFQTSIFQTVNDIAEEIAFITRGRQKIHDFRAFIESLQLSRVRSTHWRAGHAPSPLRDGAQLNVEVTDSVASNIIRIGLPIFSPDNPVRYPSTL